MGKDARLKAERRRLRQVAGRPLDLLRDLFDQIRRQTSESPRRCWELMLEIMGHYSNINCMAGGCLTADSEKVLQNLQVESLLRSYFELWNDELELNSHEVAPITDPVGAVLEENGGTNEARGQYFTPPSLVRVANEITMEDLRRRQGERCTALDMACGTGRFALDALVHYENVMVFNVDIDLWMVRAALINARYARRFSSAFIEINPGDPGLFTEESARALRARGFHVPAPAEADRLEVLGGRSWIIHADSLLVDLQSSENWRYAWKWDPPPWRSTMKLADFDGTYDEWVKRRPAREVERQIDAAQRKPLVDLKLDEAALHAQMVERVQEMDDFLAAGEREGSGLGGSLRPVQELPVLAGDGPSLPRLRRGPR